MLDVNYIYDITKTTLPMSKEILTSCLDSVPVFGYKHCKYENLIKNINEINSSTELRVSRNPDKLFAEYNDPTMAPDVIFRVEGVKQSEDEYVQRVLRANDYESWTDFTTYSIELRDDIKDLKERIFRSVLWSIDNVNNWIDSLGIALLASNKQKYLSSWNDFKNDVLLSNDLSKYVQACSSDDRQLYIHKLMNGARNLLCKYKDEVMAHLNKANTDVAEITLSNPVIDEIFILSNKAQLCKKEHPLIKFTSLSQRNFNLIGTMV